MVMLALVSLLTSMLHPEAAAHPAPHPAARSQEASIPMRNPDSTIRLAGQTGLLTAMQFRSLNRDLERLARLGTESIIYIRNVNDEATAQPWFAEDLRIGWSVESQVGARDGLVIVVSVDPENPEAATVTSSAGAHAFPIRRLTAEQFDLLTAEHVLPRLQAGETFAGLQDLAQLTLGTLFDRANELNERQLQTLDGDLRRLGELGLPITVYLQSAAPDAEPSSDLAARLLNSWIIESEPGADDGVVLVVTIDETDPEASTMAYAAGTNAFPIRQLTADAYTTIIEEEALTQVRDGDAYLGLAFAIRRAINYAEYSPPAPPPLSETQERLQTPLTILAAVLAQAAVVGYLLVPAISERRLTLTPTIRSFTIYVITTVAFAVVVGTLGILALSRVATLTGLAVFLWAVVGAPLIRAALIHARDFGTRRRASSSTIEGGARVS